MGSICLIEEDKYVTYSKVLAKYFLAEGVTCDHPVFLGSLDDVPTQLLSKLPSVINTQGNKEDPDEVETNGDKADEAAQDEGLRIAWRYNDLPVVNSEPASVTIGNQYNLKKLMKPSYVNEIARVMTWSDALPKTNAENANDVEEVLHKNGKLMNCAYEFLPSPPPESLINDEQNDNENTQEIENTNDANKSSADCCSSLQPQIFSNSKYMSLLLKLQPLLRHATFSLNTTKARTRGAQISKDLCRVCITSLGSPLWYDDNFSEAILKFLTVLRALIKSARAVCFITMPMHLVAKCVSSIFQIL